MSEKEQKTIKSKNGKTIKVYSLVLITDADKQSILLGLKKRGSLLN